MTPKPGYIISNPVFDSMRFLEVQMAWIAVILQDDETIALVNNIIFLKGCSLKNHSPHF